MGVPIGSLGGLWRRAVDSSVPVPRKHSCDRVSDRLGWAEPCHEVRRGGKEIRSCWREGGMDGESVVVEMWRGPLYMGALGC